MYTVIYLYRVNKEKIQPFLDINDNISEIFLENGALEDKIYQADNLDKKDGFRGLLDLVEIIHSEQVFFGQSVFRNKSHYEEVLNHVDSNDEINQLITELKTAIDYSKVFTGSFTTPD